MLTQPLAVGVADHRREQSFEVEVDGDREVQVAVHDESVDVDARVHVRVVVDRVGRPHGAMNGRNVSEKPSRSLPLVAVRRRGRGATRSKSTSTDVYTCALVGFDRTMCSAVRRRMLLERHHLIAGRTPARLRRGAAGAGAAGSGRRGAGAPGRAAGAGAARARRRSRRAPRRRRRGRPCG